MSVQDLISEEDEAKAYEHTFCLWPRLWQECSSNPDLTFNWQECQFVAGKVDSVPNEPGLYSFLIQPHLANHPSCSYLMYVGKTKTLRQRFKQYLREKERESGRPKVVRLLNKAYQEGALGILKLDGKEKLFAIDGQHRVAGIKEAVSGDGAPKLNDEEVCAIFLAADVTKSAGLERTRRLFSTLNRYAKPVDMMDIIALDEDDAIATVTRKLMEEYPLFKEHRISVLKGKAVPVTDKKCFTNITTLYEVNDIILASERGRKWQDFKRVRRPDPQLTSLYERAADFWNLMVHNFSPLADVQNSASGEGVAGQYRNRGGGHLLFRTIGLLSMAKAIKIAVGTNGTLTSWIRRFAKTPTDLASEPWVGLFWDPSENTMIIRKENQNTATLLLLYMVGVNLANLKTSHERLKERYASALNRPVAEVRLPGKIAE